MKDKQRFIVYALRHDPAAIRVTLDSEDGVWLTESVPPKYLSIGP